MPGRIRATALANEMMAAERVPQMAAFIMMTFLSFLPLVSSVLPSAASRNCWTVMGGALSDFSSLTALNSLCLKPIRLLLGPEDSLHLGVWRRSAATARWWVVIVGLGRYLAGFDERSQLLNREGAAGLGIVHAAHIKFLVWP